MERRESIPKKWRESVKRKKKSLKRERKKKMKEIKYDENYISSSFTNGNSLFYSVLGNRGFLNSICVLVAASF